MSSRRAPSGTGHAEPIAGVLGAPVGSVSGRRSGFRGVEAVSAPDARGAGKSHFCEGLARATIDA